MSELSELVEQIEATVERYRGNYNLNTRVAELGARERVAMALWQANRRGRLVVGAHRDLWSLLCGAPGAWEAEDFIVLYEGVADAYPGAHCESGGGIALDRDEIPGRLWGLDRLLQEKIGDAAFGQALRERWREIAEPFCIAIAAGLVQHMGMPWTELPEPFCWRIARAHLESHARLDPPLMPPREWGEQLAAVCVSDEAFTYERVEVLAQVYPHVTPETFVRALARASSNHGTQQPLTAFDALDLTPLCEPLAKALAATKIEAIPVNGWDEPWPAFMLVTLYLRSCIQAKVVPRPELDPTLSAFVEHFRVGWSGSYEAEYFAYLRESFAIIPGPRLEAILLRASSFPWIFAAACTTPTMLRAIVEALVALPSTKDAPYALSQAIERIHGKAHNDFGDGHLYDLRAELVPALVEALMGEPFPQRGLAIHLLSLSDDPRAAPAYAALLGDKTKSVREAASGMLERLPPELVIPHLEAPLGARRKPARLAAASLLASLPPSHEGLRLAKARLAREKVGEIKALLAKVRAPAGPEAPATDNDRNAEIITALERSDGAAWTEHRELGPALLDLYWGFLARRYQGKRVSRYEDPVRTWEVLLSEQGAHAGPETRRKIVQLAVCMSDAEGYLSTVFRCLPTASADLLAWFDEGDIVRPKAFGDYYASLDAKELIAWLREHQPIPALFILALGDRRKTVRTPAREALVGMGAAAAEPLEAALAHAKPLMREQAARALRELALPRSLPALEAALARETKAKARAALAEAVAATQALSLDPSSYAVSAAGDAELDTALCRLATNDLPPQLDGFEPTELRWSSGAALSSGARAWVMGQVVKEDIDHRSDTLAAVRTRLEDATCHALSEAMVARSSNPGQGWALYTQSVLGSPAQVEALGRLLDTLASSKRTAWGADGVEALVRLGTDLAVRQLDRAWKKSRRDALRWRAGAGLRRLAEARGVHVEELIDAAISELGFEPDGTQRFDCGTRSFTLTLVEGGRAQLSDASGKVHASFPKPRRDDDPDALAAVKARVSSIRRELAAAHATILRSLERAMTTGRSWPAATWTQQFQSHVVRRRASSTLVFERLADDELPALRFRIGAGGLLHDLDGRELHLRPLSRVRLAHPVDLSEAERDAWTAALGERTQPVSQLARASYRLAELPARDNLLFQSLPMAQAGRFMGALGRLGYERGGRGGAGLIDDTYGQFGAYRVRFHHTGYNTELLDEADIEFTGITVHQGEAEIPWRSAPAALISEIVRALHIATDAAAATTPAEAPET